MLENEKSVGLPSTEAGHDVKSAGFGSRFCVMSPLAAPWRPQIYLILTCGIWLGLMTGSNVKN